MEKKVFCLKYSHSRRGYTRSCHLFFRSLETAKCYAKRVIMFPIWKEVSVSGFPKNRDIDYLVAEIQEYMQEYDLSNEVEHKSDFRLSIHEVDSFYDEEATEELVDLDEDDYKCDCKIQHGPQDQSEEESDELDEEEVDKLELP